MGSRHGPIYAAPEVDQSVSRGSIPRIVVHSNPELLLAAKAPLSRQDPEEGEYTFGCFLFFRDLGMDRVTGAISNIAGRKDDDTRSNGKRPSFLPADGPIL
jgi:hypothetical protein